MLKIPPVITAKLTAMDKSIGRQFNKLANSKRVSEGLKNALEDPVKSAAGILVLSIVSKDVIGAFVYITETLLNKEIPEKKRKFVASIDLMNGFLMVLGQYGAGKLIEGKFTPGTQSKFSGILKEKDGKDKYLSNAVFAEDRLREVIAGIIKNKKINLQEDEIPEIIEAINKGPRNKFTKGLGLIIMLLVTNALIKRTIVPFISTPLATWFNKKWDESDTKKKQEKMEAEANKKNTVKSLNDFIEHPTTPPKNQNEDGDKLILRRAELK
ncbi:MAG: hypothetical protein PHC64_08845 [Candidatus Gastranaerophilales bacterium]|nr:hypothetical protein [Candidatus Gastranaerophilales bacterium]